MKSVNQNLICLFLLTLLAFCSFETSTNAQFFTKGYSNSKIKTGDSMQYKYTDIYNQGKNYITYSPNPENFNITDGTKLNIKVKDINNTYISGILVVQIITVQQTFIISENKQFIVPESEIYIIPSFNNKSSVDSYKNYLQSGITAGENITYSDNINYLTMQTNTTTPDEYVSTAQVYNWHSGWLENASYISYINGTLYLKFVIERIGTSSTNKIGQYLTDLMLFSIPVVIVIIIGYVEIKRRRKSV